VTKLTTERRAEIPGKDFALGNRRYPIEDANHARNAWTSENPFNERILKKERPLTIVARSRQLERCLKREILLFGRKKVDLLRKGV